ncbi:GNAT family N-acetyltransferase [Sphingomonas radiodurans]|uniref:GNAT family N-acetyltransferase n=1 Tax=Sphingomonas radiodurans TaxID=2890321 RepID=UPI001E51CA38|nr:GNAT family N-acetyltransferase [Sphingomonas radiodurans]WBH17361.1 GNAT family N-acetyltransferase [Sphingomonas radiodurans]
MELREGGLDDPRVIALIAHHLAEARGSTPQDNAHAMGTEALRHPDISFWAAWEGEALLGVAALRQLSLNHGEIKSMRTAPEHVRRGVARALLAHLIALARTRGYSRVSLETGTALMFDAANRMYEAVGFVDGPAFGGYPESPHNRFMTLAL